MAMFPRIIDNSFGTRYDSEIDTSPKDRIQDIDSICHVFECCLRKYGTLLLVAQTDASRLSHFSDILIPEIKNEFSRLRIWGEQTRAGLPRNARRSLDQQLREDEQTKNIVIRCLRRLTNHIEKGWPDII